jgi:hypothetical protein
VLCTHFMSKKTTDRARKFRRWFGWSLIAIG